ncbi:MAG TPA: hypothetical protein VIS74_04190 [Chthoniobacterales bacterium]
MTSRTTARFWGCYRKLPAEVRELARKNYRLWREDVHHPSLHFKPVSKGQWSVRIGIHYRATGRFSGSDEFTWDWIGTHGEYDRLA